MNDEKYMEQALMQARQSLSEGQLPVGAVIVLGDIVVGVGRKVKGANERLDHAEVCALRQAMDGPTHADGMTIYTTLEPCIMCMGTLLNCRIGRIVYAMEDAYGGALHVPYEQLPLRHQNKFPQIEASILREQARGLFREFLVTAENKFWQDQNNPFIKACLV